MFEFKFIDIGEGTAEGEIVNWRVAVGETVAEHQVLVDIETDKALVELPSPVAGLVRDLRGEPGDVIPVGSVLALIEEHTGEPEPPTDKPAALGVVGALEEAAETEETQTAAPEASDIPPALPRDRKLARELGVDLEQLRGSGPRGRITEEDVQAAAREQDAAPASERIPLRGLRRTMARTMVASVASAVHVTAMDQADALALHQLRLREQAAATEHGVRLTWLPFIVKALSLVLERFPLLNSSLDEDRNEIILHRQIDIGFAVDTPEGLLVPVLRNVRRLSILVLAAELRKLAERARERKLAPAELRGGTFTVTNYGALGGIWGTPIINPPQVAILGVGRIEQQPVVRDGELTARPIIPLSLTFDHRIIDGGTAHRFLNALVEHIEDPDLMLLES